MGHFPSWRAVLVSQNEKKRSVSCHCSHCVAKSVYVMVESPI